MTLPQLELRDPVADTEVRIVVGASFVIRLIETPTTGYRWHCELAENSVIAYAGNGYVANGTLPGSSGYRSFSFLGSLVGTGSVQFLLRRAWETGPPLRALQLSVAVSNV
jgi:predicted secreted protein